MPVNTSQIRLSRPFAYYFATAWITAIFSLAPLKLGSIVSQVGVSLYPIGVLDWLLSIWPTFLAPIFAGVALLLVIWATWNAPAPDFRRHVQLLLPSALLLPATLIGLKQTTEMDAALHFLWHIISIICFLIAVFIHLSHYPHCRSIFLTALVASTLLPAIHGWYQVYYGFEQLLQLLGEAQSNGNASGVHPAILQRIREGRAFSYFTYPNVFAAHLIMMLMPTLVIVRDWSKRVDPPKLSQIILVGLAGILLFGAISLSGNRSAALAVLLAGATVVALSIRTNRDWVGRNRRLILVGFIIVALFAILTLIKISQGRTLSSLGARVFYYMAAIEMFLNHPFLGVGIGDFFPEYLRLKPSGAEETRMPHSFFLFFLSQSGIAGGLAAAYFVLQPLLVWCHVRSRRIEVVSESLFVAITFGWFAWVWHSFTDFDLQVPATMMILVTLPLLALKFPRPADRRKLAVGRRWPLRAATLAFGLLAVAGIWRWPGEAAYRKLVDLSEPAFLQDEITGAFRLQASRLLPATEFCDRRAPWSPYHWDLLGKAAEKQKDYVLAANAFRAAAAKAPRRGSFYYHLAVCDKELGRYDEALAAIRTARSLYPRKLSYINEEADIKKRMKRKARQG